MGMWVEATAFIVADPHAAMIVAAATDATNGFNPYQLIGQAPAAAVAVLFMMGKIHPDSVLKREEAAHAETREELNRLRRTVDDLVFPAIRRSADVWDRAARHGGGDG